MNPNFYECLSCSEPTNAAHAIEWNRRCHECFLELSAGKIPKVTGPQHQPLTKHLVPRQIHGLNKTTC